jgi:uncharacterized membrane protein (DUF106 family)
VSSHELPLITTEEISQKFEKASEESNQFSIEHIQTSESEILKSEEFNSNLSDRLEDSQSLD